MKPVRPRGPLLLGAALLLAALAGLGHPADLAAAWLTAWWFWMGGALGSLATLYIHRLTGGGWGMALLPALRAHAARLAWLAPWLLPLLLVPAALYPWARPGWADPAAEPAFREAWRALPFFYARTAVCLGLWVLLAWRTLAARRLTSGLAAAGLLVLAWSISVAAVDLVASLSPAWYAAGFGLLVLASQLKLATALAVLKAAREAPPSIRVDLGNLLLTYVLVWAYLEFTQFQIIWAENLPHEIAWYLPRYLEQWRWLGLVLIAAGLLVPLVLLLFRRVKRDARALGAVAAWIAVLGWLEAVWQILPSVQGLSLHILWLLPLLTLCMGGFAWTMGAWTGPRPPGTGSEVRHA